MEQCDIAIVGAGMVGAAGLPAGGRGLSVRVIETRLPSPMPRAAAGSAGFRHQSGLGGAADPGRCLAISAADAAVPYRRLETWELDGFATRFDAVDLRPAPARLHHREPADQLALLKKDGGFPDHQTHTPAAVTSLRQSADDAVLTLDDGTELQARWVLACDGAESHTRRLAGIRGVAFRVPPALHADQHRHRLCTGRHHLAAVHPSGPRAFLPLPGRHGSLVWYDSPARIRALAAMSNEGPGRRVRRHFPRQLGGFTVTARGFPWCAATPTTITPGEWCCSGMPPTINPLAGQGSTSVSGRGLLGRVARQGRGTVA